MLSWIMSAIALTGSILNAEKSKIGFAFWMVLNLYMSTRFLAISQYAKMTLFFIYFILAIRGLLV